MIAKSKLLEYGVWKNMVARCTNDNVKHFHNYGGRGITVCDEWRDDFWAFYEHIGPRPGPEYSIDRIDNDRGYEPHNVRWALRAEQNRNRRITVWIEYRGVRLSTDQWAAILGCDVPTLSMRKNRGWTDERIIETPIAPQPNLRKPGARDRGPYRGKGLHAAWARFADGGEAR